MPLINVKLIEGVFKCQKREMTVDVKLADGVAG
jgi:hypothetical protein